MPKKPAEPEVITSADLLHPKGREFWLDDDMFVLDAETGRYAPEFSVQEVAKCFFGVKPDWLRWRMRADREWRAAGAQPSLAVDGKPLIYKRRTLNDPDSARYFTLADIERLAHALAQASFIDGTKLAHVVLMVRTCARLHGAH